MVFLYLLIPLSFLVFLAIPKIKQYLKLGEGFDSRGNSVEGLVAPWLLKEPGAEIVKRIKALFPEFGMGMIINTGNWLADVPYGFAQTKEAPRLLERYLKELPLSPEAAYSERRYPCLLYVQETMAVSEAYEKDPAHWAMVLKNEKPISAVLKAHIKTLFEKVADVKGLEALVELFNPGVVLSSEAQLFPVEFTPRAANNMKTNHPVPATLKPHFEAFKQEILDEYEAYQNRRSSSVYRLFF